MSVELPRPAINRRRFLQLAGGTAAASALAASIARASGIPADRRTGTLEDVEHIVVLMQENRSFDHYFGTLAGVRGFGDPRPVGLPSGKPVWHQPFGDGEIVPFRPDAPDLGLQFFENLLHDWDTTHQAWNNGHNDMWPNVKGVPTMAHMNRQDIPFYYALADAFTICDAYHCSLMTCTDPNRYYMWTGYTGNDGKGGGPVLDNAAAGYSWATYPERLQEAEISWRIYQDAGEGLDGDNNWGWPTQEPYIGNFGDTALLFFENYRAAAPGEPLFDKARIGTEVRDGGTYFDLLRTDVVGGRLPQVSWVVAPEAFCEHPNWPANYGAWYTSQVLDALTADPDTWSKTALFITFDENGGFFDHGVAPVPPRTPAHGASTVDYADELFAGDKNFTPGPYGLGPRLPMLVVSPWSAGGWVDSEVFDHTSILRFIEQRFGVGEPNISAWRRTVCGDLTGAFDFAGKGSATQGAAVPPLPSTSSYAPPDMDRHADFVAKPPPDAALPVQEPGLRRARPLPYDLAADGALDPDAGVFEIDFASLGTAGAVFHVISSTDPDGPWDYTVGPSLALTGTWSLSAAGAASAAYDYSVYGPNGFLRRFTGTAGDGASGLEVSVRHAGAAGAVELTLANSGGSTLSVSVSDSYRGAAGQSQSAATYVLASGGSVVHTADTRPANGWYDLEVTAEVDSGYLRRLAGHVENGQPSSSDPAIITG
jgi:phospholipase C